MKTQIEMKDDILSLGSRPSLLRMFNCVRAENMLVVIVQGGKRVFRPCTINNGEALELRLQYSLIQCSRYCMSNILYYTVYTQVNNSVVSFFLLGT